MISLRTLSELSGQETYEIFLLRQRVFMLEQNCLYQDIDIEDAKALHLRYLNENNDLLGYLRILPPSDGKSVAIGRVAVRKKSRRRGIAREMMTTAAAQCGTHFPGYKIRISAQVYLVDFYSSLGFLEVGPEYLEDDIPHQDMILAI